MELHVDLPVDISNNSYYLNNKNMLEVWM
jgi:hypothetical protein